MLTIVNIFIYLFLSYNEVYINLINDLHLSAMATITIIPPCRIWLEIELKAVHFGFGWRPVK